MTDDTPDEVCVRPASELLAEADRRVSILAEALREARGAIVDVNTARTYSARQAAAVHAIQRIDHALEYA